MTVQTSPNAACVINYAPPAGGLSTAQGLTPKAADATGRVAWSWVIDPGTQAGTIAKIPRGPATFLNAAGYLGAVVSVVEKGVRHFHALKPPAELESRYRELLRELDRNVDILQTLRSAAAAKDRKDYETGLRDLHRSRVRINALEDRLGLTGCSIPGQT